MAIKTVIRMGHPILKNIASPIIEFNTPELEQLITDMLDTMYACDGAGLAAPQIAISKRVIVFGISSNPRYPDAEQIATTILINPIIEILSNNIENGWEGCLSLPGMRGLVPRAVNIKYSGYDQYGYKTETIADGFHARVVLHEVDHLDGILYPQRIQNLSNFGYEDQLFITNE